MRILYYKTLFSCYRNETMPLPGISSIFYSVLLFGWLSKFKTKYIEWKSIEAKPLLSKPKILNQPHLRVYAHVAGIIRLSVPHSSSYLRISLEQRVSIAEPKQL
jgi:hypothetical protein